MKMIIGNKFVSSSDGETIPVINPYDQSLVDSIPQATQNDVDLAVSFAVQAQKSWKKVPVYQRAEYAMNFVELVRKNKDELAETLTRESGKNITEAKSGNQLYDTGRKACFQQQGSQFADRERIFAVMKNFSKRPLNAYPF